MAQTFLSKDDCENGRRLSVRFNYRTFDLIVSTWHVQEITFALDHAHLSAGACLSVIELTEFVHRRPVDETKPDTIIFVRRRDVALLLRGAFRVSIKTLSMLALAETISWTLLLLSMVFKYGFDKPMGVKVMGPIHGVLFIGLVLVLLSLHMSQKWNFSRTAKMFLASFIPIGGYFLISHESEASV